MKIIGLIFNVFLITILPQLAVSQNVIHGIVRDAEKNETIPFASIFVKGTNIGLSTDINGKFEIKTPAKGDSLCVNVLGYKPYCISLNKAKGNQQINFSLYPSSFGLQEVIISAGEDPAVIIIRELKKKRDKLNTDNFRFIAFNEYSHTELFFTNINPEKFRAKKFLKQFDFMLTESDSLNNNKRNFPFLAIERSKHISVSNGHKKQIAEQLLGEKVTGFYDETLNLMLDQLYMPINFFEHRIMLFNRPFVSPFSEDCFAFYNYYMVDSTLNENQKLYQIKVKPKRLEDNAFEGWLFIDSATTTIEKLQLRISTKANLNFIKGYAIVQYFEPIKDDWVITKDEVHVNFIPIAIDEVFNLPFKSKDIDKFTVSAKRVSINSNFDFDISKSQNYDLDSLELVNIEKASEKQSNEFWHQKRPEKALNSELVNLQKLDSLPKMGAYKKSMQLITILGTGFIELGKFDLGSIYRISSYNPLEGTRFRMGVRTNNNFSKSHRFEYYGAYGTGDKRFKFGAAYNFIHAKKAGEMAGISYVNDVDLRVGSLEADGIDADNVFNNILRKNNIPWFLNRIKEVNIFYTKRLFRNLTLKTQINNRHAEPNFLFSYNYKGEVRNTYHRTEVLFDLRFAPGEVNKRRSFTRGKANKVVVRRSQNPIINFTFAKGVPNILADDFSYHRLQIGLSQIKSVTPKHQVSYSVIAGRINGTIPYLLLDVPMGNDTYYWKNGGYNNMIPFEFASDKYLRWQTEYNFGGMFFDRIPFVKRLKWRELIFHRGVVGSLSDKNKELNFQNEFEVPIRAYQETGFGIGNIFNILRLDFTWRMHPSKHSLATQQRFGVYGIIQIKF